MKDHSSITLTGGAFIGSGDKAGDDVVRRWEEISSREEEIVPQYGFAQAEREVASASRGGQG